MDDGRLTTEDRKRETDDGRIVPRQSSLVSHRSLVRTVCLIVAVALNGFGVRAVGGDSSLERLRQAAKDLPDSHEIADVPLIGQHGYPYCGLVCLRMVMSYWKILKAPKDKKRANIELTDDYKAFHKLPTKGRFKGVTLPGCRDYLNGRYAEHGRAVVGYGGTVQAMSGRAWDQNRP